MVLFALVALAIDVYGTIRMNTVYFRLAIVPVRRFSIVIPGNWDPRVLHRLSSSAFTAVFDEGSRTLHVRTNYHWWKWWGGFAVVRLHDSEDGVLLQTRWCANFPLLIITSLLLSTFGLLYTDHPMNTIGFVLFLVFSVVLWLLSWVVFRHDMESLLAEISVHASS